MRRDNVQRVAVALLTAGVASCGSSASNPEMFTVRDSAEVRIVESFAPQWTEVTAWRVGEEPKTNIGAGSTDRQQLFAVRGARRMQDGRIVVANAGSYELRFYSQDGAYLRSVGGKGDGPGEFASLLRLWPLGTDSLVTFDNRQARLSVLDSYGLFVGTVSFKPIPGAGRPIPIAVFGDGSFLIETMTRFDSEPTDGIVRGIFPLFWHSRSGDEGSTIDTLPGRESFVIGRRPNGTNGRGTPVFGRTVQVIPADTTFYFADNTSYEFREIAQSGALVRIVRRRYDAMPVTQSHIDRANELRLAALDESERPAMARWYRDTPEPENMPAFAAVRRDDEGNLWVQEYQPPRVARDRWTVFDSTGVMLGDVTLPSGLDPLHIGSDFLLGLWRDDLDIEYVRQYELIKPVAVSSKR